MTGERSAGERDPAATLPAAVTELRACEFSGRFGVARVEITPPAGIPARNWGSSTHDVADGVHRPLYATCLSIEGSDGSEVALITADLGWWRSREDEAELREATLQQTGLRGDQLILHPSHTHAAPPTARELAQQDGGHIIVEYREALIESFVEIVRAARANRCEATLTWTRGSCQLAMDRNYRSPQDGGVLCGPNPGVPADDYLLVGRVAEDASGAPLAVLVNYACHPTSLGGANRLISPDYVGALRELVEAQWGGVCLFLHGASADTTPRRSFEEDAAAADQNGRELGYATLAALTSMLPPRTALAFDRVEQSGTALAIWAPRPAQPSRILRSRRVTLRLPLQPMPTRAELERQLHECGNDYARERVRRKLMLRDTVGDGPLCDFVCTILRLGDSFIVGTPAEAYTSFQASVRARFPASSIAVLNIVNGYLSYLPPQSEYELKTYQARVALFAPGSTELVLQATVEAIQELLDSAG